MQPPPGRPGGPIKAIAVDNEPEPFWNGNDAGTRIGRWLATVGFNDEWGHVNTPPGINGRVSSRVRV